MRARAFSARDTFPDILRGLAVAEEAADAPPLHGPAVVESSVIEQPVRRSAAAEGTAVAGMRLAEDLAAEATRSVIAANKAARAATAEPANDAAGIAADVAEIFGPDDQRLDARAHPGDGNGAAREAGAGTVTASAANVAPLGPSDDDLFAAEEPEPATSAPVVLIGEDERKGLLRELRAAGKSAADLARWLNATYKITSTAQLTTVQFPAVLRWIKGQG
jgi:hypothetical protein